jgi:hypothetical protein
MPLLLTWTSALASTPTKNAGNYAWASKTTR